MDLARFTFDRVERSNPPNKIKAVRNIRERKFPGACEFLIGYFPREHGESVQLEIVSALSYLKNPKAIPLLLSLLASGPSGVRFAAAGAIAACGDQGTLGALYSLLKDQSVPEMLRDRIKKTMAELHARHGGADKGLLSLSGGDDAGGLSMTEEADKKSMPDADSGNLAISDESDEETGEEPGPLN
jgi:hypothetical protein